jgi:carotenoid 1,2-hydratase
MSVQGLTGACEAGFLHPREEAANPLAKPRARNGDHASRCRPAHHRARVHLPAPFAFKAASAADSRASVRSSTLSCRTMDMCGGTAMDAATAASTGSPSLPSSARCFRLTTSGQGALQAQIRAIFRACMLCLYGKKNRWAMTERNDAALDPVTRLPDHRCKLVRWEGDRAIIDIDEVTAPLPQRVRGQITVHCDHVYDRASYLDANREHRWWPINPRARAEVRLDSPGLNWDGHAYFDSNDGDVPLEQSFDYWNWSRASLADGGAAILYDLELKGGGFRSLALRYGTDGKVEDFVSPDQMLTLPRTRWLVERQTRCEPPAKPEVVESWVDSPFYSRSVVSTQLLGEPVTAVHESLDMRRFVSPIVQIMLPVKVPRVI